MVVFRDELYFGVAAYRNNDMTGGAEVWSFDGRRAVRRSLLGFGNSSNEYILSMAVYEDHLFCGTANYSTGCELWVRHDGKEWNAVARNGLGYGPLNQSIIYSLVPFAETLWIGVRNPTEGFQLHSLRKGR